MRSLPVRHIIARTRLSTYPPRIAARHASTASPIATDARSVATRTKNLIYGTALTLGFTFGWLYVTDTRSSVHEWLVVPALRVIYPDGEDAHHAGTSMLKALYSFGLHPRERGDVDAAGDLQVEIFGQTIVNPIGTSAGIDKGAEVPTPLLALGPGVVEVGAVTPHPQDGNPKPRVFRIPSQNALINRYGFNSEGVEQVAMRLRQRIREFAYHMGFGIDEEAERRILDGEAGVPPGSLTPGRLLAVQVAKNKTTSETDMEAVMRDYTTGVAHLGKYADIIVVNVSSPNTPGLRTLQNVEPLTNLLTSVVEAVQKVDRKTKPAVMVKVSPDEDSDDQLSGICEAVWNSGVDGIIVGNTTKKRPDPIPKGYLISQSEANILLEQGGYSGPQMFQRTLDLVKRYRKLLDEGPKQLPPPTAEKSEPRLDKAVSRPTTGDEPDASIVEKIDAGVTGSTVHGSATSSIPSASTELPSEASLLSTNVDDLSEAGPVIKSSTQPSSLLSTDSNPVSTPSTPPSRKVIFATGGITNGKQAKEILEAGASVAMVYTAIIYGGVGTITRIKREMREEASKK
jgi:dihydroorotate dehydrogenase